MLPFIACAYALFAARNEALAVVDPVFACVNAAAAMSPTLFALLNAD